MGQVAYMSAWDRCPYCGSTHLQSDAIEADGLNAWSNVECLDCGKIWQEVYNAAMKVDPDTGAVLLDLL